MSFRTVLPLAVCCALFLLMAGPMDGAHVRTGAPASPPAAALACPSRQKTEQVMNLITEELVEGALDAVISFGPRVTGTPACRKAGTYLFETFSAMGIPVRYQNWTAVGNLWHPFVYRGENIEATLPGTHGTGGEVVVFNAHYDTVRRTVGADDDASGVAAVLAAASALSRLSFNHTMKFVAFSGEEVGLLGSNAYAREAYEAGDAISVEFNADMIGHANTSDAGRRFRVYATPDIEWVLDRIQAVNDGMPVPFNLTRGLIGRGRGGSDYHSFHTYGYEAVACFEYQWNPHMHEPEDDRPNVNVSYLVNTTRLIAGTMSTLADASFEYPHVLLEAPRRGEATLRDTPVVTLPKATSVCIGDLAIAATVRAGAHPIERVECYANGAFLGVDDAPPYEWVLDGCRIGTVELEVIAFDAAGRTASDWMNVVHINF
jgi:hypothetical protein